MDCMGYLAVIISVYLMWCFPAFYSRPLFVLPALSLAAVFLLKRRMEALHVLYAAAIFAAAIPALRESVPDISLDEKAVRGVYGKVVQDSQQKTGRNTGYRLLLYAASDENGNVFESHGNLYISSAPADLYYGDTVMASGYLSGEIFIASSAKIAERTILTSLRAEVNGAVKAVFRQFGDAGELASLLVLGTGSDGAFSLYSDARQSGLSHVLALSGMHLSIIASMITLPLHMVFGKRTGSLIVNAVLLVFSFLSGWRPSLMRAFIFRLLIHGRAGLEDSFILSLIILLHLFPEAARDLGAVYSFTSLGGIFLLSGLLDSSLHFLLPVPRPLSASVAASAAALIFSIPLTLAVFGSYTIGAVITSFPFNAAISLYMVLSVVAAIIPAAGFLLQVLYCVLEWGFAAAGRFPETDEMWQYLLLLGLSALVVLAAMLCRRLSGDQWQRIQHIC